MSDYSVPIAALQHYAFCPRQYALIHIEQAWAENLYTTEGRLLHEKVDSGETEQRGKLRYERSVLLRSEQYHMHGKMDLLEIKTHTDNVKYCPVEYKRGKPKVADWDRIQVCAQALCIEEMKNTHIDVGAIWYWEVRRREPITIDDALRYATIEIINAARKLYISTITPPPTDDKKRCRSCSLKNVCQPFAFSKDDSKKYIADIFQSQQVELINDFSEEKV